MPLQTYFGIPVECLCEQCVQGVYEHKDHLDHGPTDSEFGMLKVCFMRGHARHVALTSITPLLY